MRKEEGLVVLNPVTLQALAAFPAQLEAHFSAIPNDYRNWAPGSWEGVPSEPFTAIEQICHVRDIEIEGYQVRFARTLAEAQPWLPSIDSLVVTRERDYASEDPAQVFADFRLARERTLALLHELTVADCERLAEFEGYGPLTLRSLVHFLCSHDQQHLSGLQWLLGKIEALPASR
ncbi:DinB family protein [Chitinimonas sp.]|uniref:DinB family protein n=1 Tax=Chitinimonas sp. TaxID=1934313 RepID=UPI002F9404DF